MLSQDMNEKDLWAQTITVKVKLHTFDILSRSKTIKGAYLQKPDDLVKVATEMLNDLRKQHKAATFSVRLLGLRCSSFREVQRQDSKQLQIQKYFKACDEIKTPLINACKVIDQTNDVRQRIESEKRRMSNPRPPPTNQFCCPMCNRSIEGCDNMMLNMHIDSCLNSSIIREAVKEECFAAQQRKKPRLTDFFCKKA